jgi:hypothetical protein
MQIGAGFDIRHHFEFGNQIQRGPAKKSGAPAVLRYSLDSFAPLLW